MSNYAHLCFATLYCEGLWNGGGGVVYKELVRGGRSSGTGRRSSVVKTCEPDLGRSGVRISPTLRVVSGNGETSTELSQPSSINFFKLFLSEIQ